ncbi:hypothetical protein CVU76_02290 [Candidatus Dojkabacteria bacterium HGW-Dojkabacteria-1]|uniref:Uncharacterized protein n=1 Tax=Candidatus Dojkabacteria bacterium HGW-Dojkabacteria-1 TaxID=2013761 RepID=A0A2N2F3Q3_9BACT|nr:MAG: hypothetical protein CVU76_02290 [Candidatus Dojkabacteria bacterium HGW-Dojkabacteria-1]
MKKILFGFLGIFLVIGIVAGTGYALFSSKVSMTGVVLGTATPSLEIGTDKFTPEVTWYTTLPVDGQPLFKLFLPGEMDWGEFWLRNSSTANGVPLDFNLEGRITSAGGDWGLLKDAIKMRICLYNDTPGNHCDTDKTTGWMTLADWNTAARSLPGPLLQGAPVHYAINLYIDPSFGNAIANKAITGLNFEITGTQVP